MKQSHGHFHFTIDTMLTLGEDYRPQLAAWLREAADKVEAGEKLWPYIPVVHRWSNVTGDEKDVEVGSYGLEEDGS